METVLRSELFFSQPKSRSGLSGPPNSWSAPAGVGLHRPPPSTHLVGRLDDTHGARLVLSAQCRRLAGRALLAWFAGGDRAGKFRVVAGKRRIVELRITSPISAACEQYGKAGNLDQAVEWLGRTYLSAQPAAQCRLARPSRAAGARMKNNKLPTALAELLTQPEAQLA